MSRTPFGRKGLDLVSTPIKQKDGSWRRLQNAEFSANLGRGALKKRGGLSALNAVDLGGEIFNAIAVPLRSLLDAAPEGFLFATSTGFLWTTDGGVTMTPIAAPAPWDTRSFFPWNALSIVTATKSGSSHAFYVGDNGGAPWLIDFDGTTATPVLDLTGFNPTGITALDDIVYLCVTPASTLDYTSTPISGKVISWDPNLGISTPIGSEFGVGVGFLDQDQFPSTNQHAVSYGWAPIGLSHNGIDTLHLALGGYLNTGQTQTHACGPPGPGDQCSLGSGLASFQIGVDPDWQFNIGTIHSGYMQDKVGFLGQMSIPDTTATFGTPFISVVGVSGNTGPANDPILVTGSTDQAAFGNLIGNYISPADANPGVLWFSPAIYADSVLLVAYAGSNSAYTSASIGKIYKSLGNPALMTVDFDVFGTYGGNVFPGVPFETSGDVYWPWYGAAGTTNAGFVLKRAGGSGTWSQVATGLDLTGTAGVGPVPAI